MKNDNSVYYRRQQRSIALRVIFALLILAIAATAYMIIDRHIAMKTMDDLVNADYAARVLTAEKSGGTQRAGYALSQRQDETLGTYEYVTPLGFSIVSQSEKWTGQKLVDVYNELLNNKHGDEIMYISKIIIYPGPSDIGLTDSNVAGTHSQERSEYHVFIDLPALMPSTMEYAFKSDLSVIELYNMDEYDDVTQAAMTISHEYGHHYTMFYFLKSDEAAKASEYYQLRGFDGYDHEVFFNTVDEYYANHAWSIYEIAAEDYVQLMGSGSGRKTEEYLDVYDLATSYSDNDYYRSYNDSIVNVYPQENIYIPLADQIDGLRDYFYSFVGLQNDTTPVGNPNFHLTMTKRSNMGSTYYDITWNKTSTDPNTLYTLVCYDMNGNLHSAIRTVHGDDTPVARVGKYVVQQGTQLVWYDSDVTEEDRYFKLTVLLPDGRMQASELFYADF